MIKFNKPENLNGTELIDELNNAGVKIDTPPLIDGNNDLWLEINSKDKDKAEPVVAAHNGITIKPDNSEAKAAAEAKLEALGLTKEDLEALGL